MAILRRTERATGDERVCGSADLAQNFIQILDFNNNFSGDLQIQ